jgi:site-specific DNA recombinase
MPDTTFFKPVFDSLAIDGYIGAPYGELAYCYLRVSTPGQAEEGRTGLPRQISHIHEIAQKEGYRIPWDFVFADDHSGFDFQDRPALNNLLNSVSKHRQANTVVIEYLDRLSRNADWHQGYLLEQFTKAGVNVLFWKGFGSRIERAVIGAISQDGMERARQIMQEGKILKAKSGRVTVGKGLALYGYQLVDSSGQPSDKARKDSHYGIKEEEAQVIRLLFEEVAYSGKTLRQVAKLLTELYPPPKNASMWETRRLAYYIHNETFKGDFYANMYKQIVEYAVVEKGFQKVRKKVYRTEIRPREEWIHVPVPAIVTPVVWEAANRALEINRRTSIRNSSVNSLLRGLLFCSVCGCSLVRESQMKNWSKWTEAKNNGIRMTMQDKLDNDMVIPIYRCSSHMKEKAWREEHPCPYRRIETDVLDDAVWSLTYDMLVQPERILRVLEEDYMSTANQKLLSQIRFLEEEIGRKEVEDKKLYQAYINDIIDMEEYGAQRKAIKETVQKHKEQIIDLQGKIISAEQIEARKRIILQAAQLAKTNGIKMDAPFELKQKIIRTVIDRVFVDIAEGRITVEGYINGEYSLEGLCSNERNRNDAEIGI